MKKRVLSLALTLVMLISVLSVFALAADIPFTDVPANQWYYHDVKNAYENDLINGKTPTKFAPNDNLTYAEAVKLAACMSQRYETGSVTLENGDPWYQSYVDYCKTAGIISKDYSWNSRANRAGYMEIFASALPGSALREINEIPDGSIPDVPMTHPQAAAIYKLYRAGILQGNDDAHSCFPSSNIKRSEVAAILTRMMDASKRVKFSMDVAPLRIAKQPTDVLPAQHVDGYGTIRLEAAGGKQPYHYHWEYQKNGRWEDYVRSDWVFNSSLDEPYLQVTACSGMPMCDTPIRCTVTDAAGQTVVSESAKVITQANPLTITKQPVGCTAQESGWDSLHVEVTGGKEPYTYQWCYIYGGRDYLADRTYTNGRDTDTLEIFFHIQNPMLGTKVYCDITDRDGNLVTTDRVTVDIDQKALHFYKHPSDISGVEGTFGSTDVIVDGGVSPYYLQWQYLSGGSWYNIDSYYTDDATAPTLEARFDRDNPMVNGFRCVVTDHAGNQAISNYAYMTVEAAPELRIVRQPDDVYFYAPATQLELDVLISGGVAPYTYCWYITDCYGTDYLTMDVLYDSDYTFNTYDTTNIFVCNVTNSDFIASPNGFECCCIITDAAGTSVTSNIGHIW